MNRYCVCKDVVEVRMEVEEEYRTTNTAPSGLFFNAAPKNARLSRTTLLERTTGPFISIACVQGLHGSLHDSGGSAVRAGSADSR